MLTSSQFMFSCIVGLAMLILLAMWRLRYRVARPFAWSFALGHFAFIVVLALLYFLGTRDGQSRLYWIFPSVIDLPVSLILLLLRPRALGDAGVAVVLAILGTIQYFLIGLLVDVLIAKRRY